MYLLLSANNLTRFCSEVYPITCMNQIDKSTVYITQKPSTSLERTCVCAKTYAFFNVFNIAPATLAWQSPSPPGSLKSPG